MPQCETSVTALLVIGSVLCLKHYVTGEKTKPFCSRRILTAGGEVVKKEAGPHRNGAPGEGGAVGGNETALESWPRNNRDGESVGGQFVVFAARMSDRSCAKSARLTLWPAPVLARCTMTSLRLGITTR